MERTIWNLKVGDAFRTTDGQLCQVVSKSEDGKGLVAVYLEGDLKDEQDFVFEEEIDFQTLS